MSVDVIKLENSWKYYLINEFYKDYMISLKKFLINEKKIKIIYPCNSNIFKAFDLTPIDSLKVVILGQDPYCKKGQAHGLSFSVLPGISIPPSLRNIYKELYFDLGISVKNNGCLYKWANQGVFLLNSVLTVEKDKPGSHFYKGWEIFTDKVIEIINFNCKGIVFILWGNHAINKCKFIDLNRHFVIKSSHPSPLSAKQSFFGSKPFSRANNYLKNIGKDLIKW